VRAIGYQCHRHGREFGDTLCARCLAEDGLNPLDPMCRWNLLRPEEMSEGPVYCGDCGVSLEPTYREGTDPMDFDDVPTRKMQAVRRGA
jgi:hypothetical protein